MIFQHISITPVCLCSQMILSILNQSNPSLMLLIFSDTDSLLDWSRKWRLECNQSKCVHMYFSQLFYSKPFTFYLDGTPIQTVRLHRDLGIILSSDWNWTAHYNHILSKAYRSFYLICRNFPINSSTKIKLHLFYLENV